MKDFNYGIYNELMIDTIEYLLKDDEIKNKTIKYLINKKQDINEEIESIIYLDYNGYDLTEKELNIINNKRDKIDTIYHIIEKLEGVR